MFTPEMQPVWTVVMVLLIVARMVWKVHHYGE
jgi:hypothetical protein